MHQASEVERAAFEEAALKKNIQLKVVDVLEDFSASVLLLKKRGENEMKTPQMLAALMADTSPAIQVRAGFENEMKFSLRPSVF